MLMALGKLVSPFSDMEFCKTFNRIVIRLKKLRANLLGCKTKNFCSMCVSPVSINYCHCVKNLTITHEAIEYGNSLLTSLINMETGLRGYLIAGEENFLEPFEQGQQVFTEVLAKAKQHVSDNPTQVNRLNELETLKSAWIDDHAKPAIVLRGKVKQGARTIADVTAFIERGLGKQSMDQMRVVLATFVSEEEKLMGVRQTNAESAANWTIYLSLFGALFAVLCCMAIVLVITRNIMAQLGTEPATHSG
jgi:CHASE3 domain sensor protein